MPAYGAGRTLEQTARKLPETVDIRILVESSSSDATATLAERLDDYQYTPWLVTAMANMIRVDHMVLASRILGGGARKGGMPLYNYVANRVLAASQNHFLGIKYRKIAAAQADSTPGGTALAKAPFAN